MVHKGEDNVLTRDHNMETSIKVAEIVAQTHHVLDTNIRTVQSEITSSFERLVEAIRFREKQLLRQVDVLQSQQLTLLQSPEGILRDTSTNDEWKSLPQVKVDLQDEKVLVNNILSFGRVEMNGGGVIPIDGTVTSYPVPYKIEDYQDANQDHVCLYKPLSDDSTSEPVIRFGIIPKLNLSSHSVSQNSPADMSLPEDTENEESEVSLPECLSISEQERCPSQVEHWLQQIKAETETEPSVAELDKKLSFKCENA